jgi:hypothetical protein
MKFIQIPLNKVIHIANGKMQIFVKTLIGKTIDLNVNPCALIEDIKDLIDSVLEIPPD